MVSTLPPEAVSRAVAALSDGVVLTDPNLPDHPIVWTNDAFLELTGYRRDEVVGRNCRFLQGPQTDQRAVQRIREAVANREDFHDALLNYRKDGTAFWNALTVSPVLDADGRLVNFVAAQSDISHVKRMEAGLRHAERIEVVGQMAGGVAHDFNNVLTALNGYLALLELEVDGDVPRSYLAEMARAADRAKTLTDRLLVFSRKRDSVAAVAELDVNDAVEGLRGMLEPLLRGRAGLELQLAERELPVVANLGELEQVIVNLVVNARDASHEQGQVRVHTRDDGEAVAILVEDDGSGMDVETQRRIFEPFFTTKGEGRGTGLGLANVREIVERAGGSIEVDSSLGEGSRFTVRLPRAGAAARAA